MDPGMTVLETLQEWLSGFGMTHPPAAVLATTVIVIGIVLAALLANLLAKRVIMVTIRRIVQRTKSTWDDMMVNRGVFTRLSRIAPALVVYFANPLLFPETDWVTDVIQRAAIAYMVGVAILVLDAILDGAHDIYQTFSQISKRRPIKGYIQLVKILVYIIGVILIVTTILGTSPVGILGGIGAMSAVLLLVFKDSILGLVAGLQLSGNNMVQIGDWIEMPKYGADGDVIDITLQSVKVQNWDKTITTIPIYSLVSDSFRNWRGMSESGGRRIKRAISIDMRSVKFCTPELIERFKQYELIREYVISRDREIAEHNAERGLDERDLVSGRRMTNLGTFRAYIAAYLHNHPKIHQEMTFLVRHLAPGPTGIPIEIYVFSADQAWANYEGIQADMMDHLLAVLPEFELRVFQQPSGWDIQSAAESVVGRISAAGPGS